MAFPWSSLSRSAGAVVLSALLLAAQEDRARATPITQGAIDAALARALPAARRTLGAELGSGVRARTAEVEEVEAALLAENRELMTRQLGDPVQAEEAAAAFAHALAPALLAKYALLEREILVVPSSFERIAELIGEPAIDSVETLRGVLLHEVVHAADDELFQMGATLLSRTNAEQVMAFQAVMEGHAQAVARRLAGELGWTAGFETFDRAISAPPAGPAPADEISRTMLRLQLATAATMYHDGERFMLALDAEGGAEAVRKAFLEPPLETGLIYAPEWFLHPERRPALAFDFDASLDRLAATFPEAEWRRGRLTLTPPQLEAVLALLDKEDVRRILAHLRQSRVQQFVSSGSGAQRLISVGLLEFDSAAEAIFYQASYERLNRLRDEAMKEGGVSIAQARYTPLVPPAPAGLFLEKTMRLTGVGGQTKDEKVYGACAVRGPIAVEVLYQGQPVTLERAVEFAVQALDGAIARSAESARPAEATTPAGPEGKKD